MNASELAYTPLVEAFAGVTAGISSTLVAHPLDLVKTRLQVNRATEAPRLGDSCRLLWAIAQGEGGYLAVYRGLTPNVLGNCTSWALYFLFYDQAKRAIGGARSRLELSYADFFLASGTAGLVTAACTNPIWVIKTRMLSSSASFDGAYHSLQDGVRQLYNLEGLRGFYRGFVPSMIGVSHGAVQFMVYEKLKLYRESRNHAGKGQLGSLDYIMLSGTSKLIAGAATYPSQVLRSRLQTHEAERTYCGFLDASEKILKLEGIKGFYKGLMPNLLRVLPSTCITFLVYENVRKLLAKQVVP